MVSSHIHRKYRPVHSANSGFVVAFVLALCTVGSVHNVSAQERPQQQPVSQMRPMHIVRKRDNLKPQIGQQAPGTPHLDYYGGPVVSNIQVVVVFWGTRVSPTVTSRIGTFFKDITQSTYFDLASEYSTTITPVGGGTGTNQSIGRGSYAGAYTIAPSFCATAPCTLSDDQIQAEILNQVSAGNLPTPTLDSNGEVDTLYMTYFAPRIVITQGGTASCVAGGFCAYHGTTSNTLDSKNLLYGVVPDFGTGGGCDLGCGNGTEFQNITSVSSHELIETVTDADVGLAQTFAPPLAWYDSSNGEIGDICNAQQAQVTAGGSTYTIQKVWSNFENSCISIGAHPSFDLNAPSALAGDTPFNFTVTAQNPTDATTDTSFIGTIHFTSSDPGAILPSDYTFVSTDRGSQTFGTTLKTKGSQTIEATDTVNGAITGLATISISALGNLTVSPVSIAFGAHVTGITYNARKVTLTNNAGGAVSISSISIGGTDANDFQSSTTCGSTLAATKSCSVSVAFTAGAIGSRTGSLIITDDAGNSPQTVMLAGVGTSQVALTPRSETFVKTIAGNTSSAKTVTVKNDLKRTLNIFGVTVTGANPGDFVQSATNCGTTLAPEGSCTISIEFKPVSIGSRSAVLSVSDDASPNSQSIDLSGTGK